jgi:hypothetical protein
LWVLVTDSRCRDLGTGVPSGLDRRGPVTYSTLSYTDSGVTPNSDLRQGRSQNQIVITPKLETETHQSPTGVVGRRIDQGVNRSQQASKANCVRESSEGRSTIGKLRGRFFEGGAGRRSTRPIRAPQAPVRRGDREVCRSGLKRPRLHRIRSPHSRLQNRYRTKYQIGRLDH